MVAISGSWLLVLGFLVSRLRKVVVMLFLKNLHGLPLNGRTFALNTASSGFGLGWARREKRVLPEPWRTAFSHCQQD